MPSRKEFFFSLLVVCLLAVFHVHFKTTKIFVHPTWDAHHDVGQFWSEFAFHYRFAKFFAEHSPREWGQLARDTSVQFPDTINDWTEFTVAMEIPVGVFYRWWHPPLPFHEWVVWCACVFSSFALLAAFLLARTLWHSNWAGLGAAFLYAALYPSYGRTVKNLFLREDFALPLILLALWATVRMWQTANTPSRQILAGGLWLAALASWHLTQFVLTIVVAAMVVTWISRGQIYRQPWFVITLAVGAVALPVLWAKQFYLSVPMCALYGLTAAAFLAATHRARSIMIFSVALVVALGAGWWLQHSFSEYAHVYHLFWYKLRYLGIKPDSPSALPWEARLLWEGAFNTAGPADFWRSLGWSLVLAILAVCRRQRLARGGLEFAWFGLLLVPLAWMVLRNLTFLAPATAVLAAGLLTRPLWWRGVWLAALLWQWATLNYDPLDRSPVKPEYYRDVVAWVQEHTAPDAVLLASISESPVFWAHTGRPIILHSKFENQRIRDRYREFLAALYGSPAELHAFARRYGADYFIYDRACLVTGKDTWRYKADRLAPLPVTSAAALLEDGTRPVGQFLPVFNGDRFVVYRVLD